MGARGMAGQAAREPGDAQGARIDAGPDAGDERFPGPVEALPRPLEQRLSARERAGEGPEIGPAAFGEAQHRPEPSPLELGQRRDELSPHGHGEFRRGGRRRRAHVGGEVDQRPIGLVADGGDEGDRAAGDRPDRHLLVEAPQVLERAAAARHDQHVGPRNLAAFGQCVEAVDRPGDLGRGRVALHAHRPHHHPHRKTVGEPVQNVADDGAGRGGHDAHHLWQVGRLALARGVEQALRGEALAARLEERHQRAEAGKLELLDDDLVARLARKRRKLPGRDDFEPFLRLDSHADQGRAPDDCVEPGVGVLQAEIGVTRGMSAAIAENLSAHPDIAEAVLDRALDRVGQIADGDDGRVGRARLRLGHRPTMPDRTS
jgi:hypothetical protein